VAEPGELHLDALGSFRRSRCWLAPAASADLVVRQEAVVKAALGTGADLHRHYRPGAWVPHLTLAPRLHTADLPVVARIVYDVLPVTAPVTRAALIDTSNGNRHRLGHLV
jgi:2'-5' RNA ligase